VLVVDDGSSDRTAAVAARWTDRLPGLTVLRSPVAGGPAAARNRGVARSHGQLLAFCDADDRVSPQWLHELIRVARHHDAVGGWLDIVPLNPAHVRRWRFTYPEDRLPVKLDHLPYAQSANLAVWRKTFLDLGGFDERHRCPEDIDFSWRLQKAGYSLGFARRAVVDYRLRSSLRMLAHQYRSFGEGDAMLVAKHRDVLPLRGWKAVPGHLAWLGARIPYLLWRPRRGIWIREASHLTGILIGACRHGLIAL
jgi:glycosyltransferase involved in cell wall biosynthesis